MTSRRELEIARSHIAVHGVFIRWVSASRETPCYAYTAGLFAFDHPELIVFGTGTEDSELILNLIGFRVRDGVQRFDAPAELPDFGNGYPVRLTPVANSQRLLKVSNDLYRDAGKPPVAALQVVYPDKEYRWPWEEGSTVSHHPLLAPLDFDPSLPLPRVSFVEHEPE